MMDVDSEKILLNLKNGSIEAFEQIYRIYSGTLYNYIYKISQGDLYMAEEIVQYTFVRLWEMHEQINPQVPILYFLGKISKNRLVNMYQHRTVEYIYSEYVQKKSAEYDSETEENLNLNSLNDYIDHLVKDLPPVRKEIFILSKRKYLSNKEIAQMMNISESTVASHLHLAIKYLRDMLSKYSDYVVLLVFCDFFLC